MKATSLFLPLFLVASTTAIAGQSADGGGTDGLCGNYDLRSSGGPLVLTPNDADSSCSYTGDDGVKVTVTPDPDVRSCSLKDGGDNIIVIWPMASEEAGCVLEDDGGVNVVVIWPT